MASEMTYVLVEIKENNKGHWKIRSVARRPSIGELIPMKRDLLIAHALDGVEDTAFCEIWGEELGFGEGHYL